MRRHGNEGALAWAGGPRNLRLPRARRRTWGNPSRERGSDRAFAGGFRGRSGGNAPKRSRGVQGSERRTVL